MTTLRNPRRHRANATHADALYGAFYPANHLRIVSLCGDHEDSTRGLLTLDRDVGAVPWDVELWVGDRKGFYPQPANPRVCRVSFNCPLFSEAPWSFNPSLGSFWGADGCADALAASGVFQPAGGAPPAGKIWLIEIRWLDTSRLSFAFSTSISVGGGNPGGFWCLDEWGNTQYGASADQADSNVARVVFPGNVPEHGRAGLLGGFDDLAEAADLLTPVTFRI